MHLLVELLQRVNEVALVAQDLEHLDDAVNLFDNGGSRGVGGSRGDLLFEPVELLEGQVLLDQVQVLEQGESLLELLFNLALRLRGRELAFLPELSLLELLVVDLLQDVQVLEEVLLVAIHRKHLEDRNHLVIPLRHHVVEEGGVIVPDLALEGVLPQDLVLELYDGCEVLLLIGRGIALATGFIWVVIDFQVFIGMRGMLVLGGLPSSLGRVSWLLLLLLLLWLTRVLARRPPVIVGDLQRGASCIL